MGLGATEGLGNSIRGVGEDLVLNALTFGGYGTYRIASSMWVGYLEDGFLGTINAVNPFYAIGKGIQDTVASASASAGDYRAAGSTGIVALVLAAVTIVGVANGAADLVEKSAAGGAAGAAGAAENGEPAVLSKVATEPPPVTTRNAHLAGGKHPTTGVPFDAQGYPDFRAVGVVQKEVKIDYTGTRWGDEALANKAAGYDRTPNGMTWHHHQDRTTMQLVPKGIHRDTGHTGGFSIKKG